MLNNLFNPKSIAIVGASPEDGKVGNVLAKNLADLGYAGEIFFVNPKHEEIFGRKCYQSLANIKEDVELAVIAIPAKFVNATIEECANKIKNFVVISAGFAETNEEGKVREKELDALAKKYDLNIIGPNCLGFIVPKLKLNASFAGGLPEAGNIAFVSQSGALAVAIMDIAKKENIKFSYIISVGNKMQIDESELLKYLNDDEDTKVIAMYLEGIKDGKRFMEVAQEVSRNKPVVILKAGKTEKTQKAISSHTGALAGSDETIDAVFEKTGIIRAENLENFFSLINFISANHVPATDKAVIITNAGGPGVLTTDEFKKKSVGLADLDDEVKKEFRNFLPEESSVENPIDLLGDALEDRYEKALEIIGRQEKIGSVICVLTPQDQTPVEKVADKVIEFKNRSEKAVMTIFIGGERVEKAIAKLKENNVPNFSFPKQAIQSLDEYYKWSIFKNTSEEKKEKPSFAEVSQRKEKVSQIIASAKAVGRSALLFSEAKEVMETYGIRTIDSVSANHDPERLVSVKFPVVVKVDSDKVLHKTDRQGLILNIQDQNGLEVAIEKMRENFPGENIIVQPMLPRQTELILGIKKDAVFGPIVLYGLGGIYTEIFKMVDFLVPPLSTEEIRNDLVKGKLAFLFEGARGQKAYDINELAEILHGLAKLAVEIGEIKELDVNPLIAYNNGDKAMAVDVKIII